MKHIVLGILAHVDAGKTTLSENLLYLCGNIRSMGRVDKKDAFFDSNEIERDRGITIFSKQARLTYEDMTMDLLDTPGHVDFGAEMERTLQVLDYAILLISAADGVDGHTLTLWKLLKRYEIPTLIFVNKMDQPGSNKEEILAAIRKKLTPDLIEGNALISYMKGQSDQYDSLEDIPLPADSIEDIAGLREDLMESYLDENLSAFTISTMADLIRSRLLVPVFWGSALKSEGVKDLLAGIHAFTRMPDYRDTLGLTIYKITREGKTRLSHAKVTGGELRVRTTLGEHGKINQLRRYSGEKYETTDTVKAGEICTIVGLENTKSGQVIGEGEAALPVLEPVLTYRIIGPEDMDPMQLMPLLEELEEEIPELHLNWNEETKEMEANLMGEVQTEVLMRLVKERYGLDISFGQGKILYKETISTTVEGVGHFEPLRHYAEVHLLLEPAPRGSGIEIATDCREEILAKNWQRLIMTHLSERVHRGVLTGAPLTDVKITVVAGRAHPKHTEGGDFRQATYRAVRQGLMQAESVLLEPYYAYELRVPTANVGRAMMDIERMHGSMEGPFTEGDKDEALLTGTAAVSAMREYSKEVTAYTKGHGSLRLTFYGYEVCHGAKEVIEEKHYQPESDLRNTPDSVFCAQGAGFVVPWYEVPSYMHVESYFNAHAYDEKERLEAQALMAERKAKDTASMMGSLDMAMGYEEVDSILAQTTHANAKNQGNHWKREKAGHTPAKVRSYDTPEDYVKAHEKSLAVRKIPYLLVDGYNVIFAWEELKALAKENIDGARGRLLDIMCNYQALIGKEVIVVFDAYRLHQHPTEYSDYHNIHVVYTKTAETADHYIEQFTHIHKAQYDITVATSDGVEQVIVRGQGATLLSSRELEADVRRREEALKAEFM